MSPNNSAMLGEMFDHLLIAFHLTFCQTSVESFDLKRSIRDAAGRSQKTMRNG